MKKNMLSKFTSIMYVLFVILTIIVLFAAYNNLNNKFIVKIGIGYVFFTFIFLIYIVAIFILRVRKLKWIEIRQRLIRFSITFIGLFVVNIIINYLINNEINILDRIYSPLVISFGINFLDLLWKNTNK